VAARLRKLDTALRNPRSPLIFTSPRFEHAYKSSKAVAKVYQVFNYLTHVRSFHKPSDTELSWHRRAV
jgi:hypothetical protein